MMCDIGELDRCSAWREDKRRARVEHRCSCCDGAVRPGEEYIVHFSVYAGTAVSEKLCADCAEARRQFFDAHSGGRESAPTSFRELLETCISDDDGEDATRWKPMSDAMDERRGRG